MLYLFGLVIVVLVSGCSRNKVHNGLYETGRIEYKIVYIENNLKNISPAMLPKKMRLEFNQESSSNNIEGFMGVFKLHNIVNLKHRRSSTHLEVLNKSYFYKGRRGEDMCCFDKMGKIEIEHLDEWERIAGLNARKALVRFPNSNETFEVYYTNDINLRNPNVTNPYRDIDGVLLDFRLNLSGIKMRFIAERFEDQNRVNPADFQMRKDFTEVTKEQMNKIIQKLME